MHFQSRVTVPLILYVQIYAMLSFVDISRLNKRRSPHINVRLRARLKIKLRRNHRNHTGRTEKTADR
ncbi:hypothetical protein BDR05DRAFT_259706 [Suillus weaverae]|nr:hypothetical protein BDR05DRAFT_259706 [Suillus weaverae]